MHEWDGLKFLAAAVAAMPLLATAPAEADVTISSGQTENMSCSGGVCAPTAANAVLNVGDLETLLASGSVEVTTTGSGVQADNIDAKAALSWSSGNSLALDAYQSIAVDKAVTVSGVAGVALKTNDGGSGGALTFGGKGGISFANLSSTLAINGKSYTLVNTVQSLASAIASNPSGTYAFASNYDASKDGTYTQSPITTTFEGTLEGLGNTISNLSASGDQTDLGLFSVIGTSGTVNDIRLANVLVTDGISEGGLAGETYGSLSGDTVSGVLKSSAGYALVGGLVGGMSGTISHCSSSATITDYRDAHAAGGLVGDEGYATISNSFATGSVTVGHEYVGGDVWRRAGRLYGRRDQFFIRNRQRDRRKALRCWRAGRVHGKRQ